MTELFHGKTFTMKMYTLMSAGLVSLAFVFGVMDHCPEGYLTIAPRLDTLMSLH